MSGYMEGKVFNILDIMLRVGWVMVFMGLNLFIFDVFFVLSSVIMVFDRYLRMLKVIFNGRKISIDIILKKL